MVTVERTLAFRFPDPNQPRKLFENPLGFLDPDYGRELFAKNCLAPILRGPSTLSLLCWILRSSFRLMTHTRSIRMTLS